jgi:hypothetical protein
MKFLRHDSFACKEVSPFMIAQRCSNDSSPFHNTLHDNKSEACGKFVSVGKNPCLENKTRRRDEKKIPKQPEKKKSRENFKPPQPHVKRSTGLLIEAWRRLFLFSCFYTFCNRLALEIEKDGYSILVNVYKMFSS